MITPITDLDDKGPDAPVTAAALSANGQAAVYATNAANVLAGFSDRNAESADGYAWLAPVASGEDDGSRPTSRSRPRSRAASTAPTASTWPSTTAVTSAARA